MDIKIDNSEKRPREGQEIFFNMGRLALLLGWLNTNLELMYYAGWIGWIQVYLVLGMATAITDDSLW